MKTKHIIFKAGHTNDDSDDGCPRAGFVTLSATLVKRIKTIQAEVIRMKKNVNPDVMNVALFDYSPTMIEQDVIEGFSQEEETEEGEFTDIIDGFDNGGDYFGLSAKGHKKLNDAAYVDIDAVRLFVSDIEFWWEGAVKSSSVSWYSNRIPIHILD